MKNAEFIIAAFHNCCLVEKNNLFSETLIFELLLVEITSMIVYMSFLKVFSSFHFFIFISFIVLTCRKALVGFWIGQLQSNYPNLLLRYHDTAVWLNIFILVLQFYLEI